MVLIFGDTNYDLTKNYLENYIKRKCEHFGYMCIAYEHKHYDSVFAYLNSIERLNILSENFKNDPDYEIYREKINILLENAEKKFNRNNIENIMRSHCIKNDLSFNDINNYINRSCPYTISSNMIPFF